MGNSIVLDNASNIFVAGNSRGDDNDFAIWKYLSNGILDINFGIDGIVVYDSGVVGNSGDRGQSLALEGDSHIFITGANDDDMMTLKFE